MKSHLGITDQMELVHQLTGVLNTLTNRIACSQIDEVRNDNSRALFKELGGNTGL